jgi:hypothetical protein
MTRFWRSFPVALSTISVSRVSPKNDMPSVSSASSVNGSRRERKGQPDSLPNLLGTVAYFAKRTSRHKTCVCKTGRPVSSSPGAARNRNMKLLRDRTLLNAVSGTELCRFQQLADIAVLDVRFAVTDVASHPDAGALAAERFLLSAFADPAR